MRVLVIDDDDETCRVIETFLKQKGHSSVSVQDAKSGLEMIKKHGYDRVILDMSMPKMTGMDFLNEFEKIDQIEKSKIVVYSAVPFTEDEMNYILKKGVCAFLSKEKGLPELEKALVVC